MEDAIDLKAIRTRLGWTQDKMADFLGLDRSSVSRIERGDQPVTGPIKRLLDHLPAKRNPKLPPAREAAA